MVKPSKMVLCQYSLISPFFLLLNSPLGGANGGDDDDDDDAGRGGRGVFFFAQKYVISPFFLTPTKTKNIGATIRIGREIRCLPYVRFLCVLHVC